MRIVFKGDTKMYLRYKRKLERLERREATVADVQEYLDKLILVRDKMSGNEYDRLTHRAEFYIMYIKERYNV